MMYYEVFIKTMLWDIRFEVLRILVLKCFGLFSNDILIYYEVFIKILIYEFFRSFLRCSKSTPTQVVR